MLDWFLEIDYMVFRYFNQIATAPWLDWFLPKFTSLHTIAWIKFGLLPLGLGAWIYFVRKKALRVVVALILTIGIADTLSYRGLKPLVDRPRPHHSAEHNSIMRLNYGPKSGSFPSNHAMSSAAAAMTLSWYYPPVAAAFWTLAIVNGYSRVYVGVHFPSDVIFGWIFGFFVSYLLIRLLFSRVKFFNPDSDS